MTNLRTCPCHCHEEATAPAGWKCRCIKNCEHCRPENVQAADTQPHPNAAIERIELTRLVFAYKELFYRRIIDDGDEFSDVLNDVFDELNKNLEKFIVEIKEESYQKGFTAGAEATGTQPTMAIPISAGKEIAEKYGYEQVIIIARMTGEKGREHVTTYGINKTHCDIAARIGDFLKFKVMGWVKDDTDNHPEK